MGKYLNKSHGTFLIAFVFSILFPSIETDAHTSPDRAHQKSDAYPPKTDEQAPRSIISLNGTWEFDQTLNAFPPSRFTRKIPVPGLIHLAEPRIEEYDKFFKRPGKAESVEQFNLYNLDYTTIENDKGSRCSSACK